MRALRLSVVGARGVVGETLTAELLVDFAQAFATYVGTGPVLVSRDIGNSGKVVAPCVVSGLMGSSCEVVDLGIYPTLALQLAIKQGPAAGGCDRGPDGRSGLESCGSCWRVIAVSPGAK